MLPQCGNVNGAQTTSFQCTTLSRLLSVKGTTGQNSSRELSKQETPKVAHGLKLNAPETNMQVEWPSS